MDVDTLINRHRQRLEEHRRFLDGDAAQQYTSPKLEVPDSLFVKPNKSAVTANQSGASAAATDESPYDIPATADYNNANDTINNDGPGSVGYGDDYYPAGGSAEYDSQPRTNGNNNNNGSFATTSNNANNNNTSRYTLHSAPPANISNVQLQIEMNSKYYTNSPHRMFDRSQQWLANRERNLMNTYHEVYRGKDAECTFHPETHTAAYSANYQHHHYAPPAMIDVGEANFIERQRAARMLKDEASKKMLPDTSKWENRRTVPKAFELNRRGETTIPSLKRPTIAQPLKEGAPNHTSHSMIVGGGARARSGSNMMITSGSSRSKTPTNNNNHNHHGGNSRTTSPVLAGGGSSTPRGFGSSAPTGRSSSATINQHHQHPSAAVVNASATDADFEPSPRKQHQQQAANHRSASAQQHQKAQQNNNDQHQQQQQLQNQQQTQRLSAEVEALKEMIRQQQSQIETLTQGLALAQRELVVARATIRDLSLNPQ